MNLQKLILTHALALLVMTAQSQDIAQDSMVVRTFSNADFRASALNYSSTEDENGILYFGNENGVLEYDGARWKLHPLPDYAYAYIVEMGPNGRLFIGGEEDFGYMERDSVGNLQYRSVRKELPDSIELGLCYQIVVHRNRTYYQTYEGLVRWDGELAHHLPIENGWFIPLGDDLLVSVFEKGIGRLAGDSLIYLNTDLSFEEDNPHTLLPYKGSELIVVTEYNGLFLLDTTTFESRTWDVEANKTLKEYDIWIAHAWNDSTYLISLTDEKMMWVNREGKVIKTIGHDEGFEDGESLFFYRDSKGDLWIPGYGVHHVFWPGYQDFSATKTEIRFIGLNDQQPVIRDRLIDKELTEPLRSILFEYATPGVDKIDLEFSTQLIGFDDNWSSWGDAVSKEYTNLSGGNYEFRVRSRHLNGQVFPTASIPFSVHTPWYNKGWAKMLGGLIVWFIFLGIYRFRTFQLRKRNEKLEQTVSERTKELESANEKLAIKNYELDQFVRRVSHDLVAPMKSVKALVEITRFEKTPEEQEKCFQMIESSLSKQEQFIRRMLDQAVNYREVKSEEVNLYKVCKDAIDSLSHFDGSQEISIQIDFDKTFTFMSDPDRVKIVFTNLITNAIKYRKLNVDDSYLRIYTQIIGNSLKVDFEDNGMGIEESQKEHIFEMFKRASVQSHGSGLGLYITKDMMEKMGGSIEVQSEEGVGTTFSLSLPI